jgi:hypothetical protein
VQKHVWRDVRLALDDDEDEFHFILKCPKLAVDLQLSIKVFGTDVCPKNFY